VSKYSPSGYIAREAARIVQVTEIVDSANTIRVTEFWRLAALTLAYAKTNPQFAALRLKDLRWWARNVTGLPVPPELASAHRAYSTLHERG
jgi:hypothetical protein